MGPIAHLVYAAAIAQKAGLLESPDLTCAGPDEKPLAAALAAGALAPDAGYYPGADRMLSSIAHGEKAVELALALARLASSGLEKAFVLGWASHLNLDVRGHAELVDVASGSRYADDPLGHTRVEWGVDCRLLSERQNLWLWSLFPLQLGGISLWHRALEKAGCGGYEPAGLEKALLGEFDVVSRLPVVWRRLGLTREPGKPCLAGKWMGPAARGVLAAFFRLARDMDKLAVATPRTPDPGSWQKWLVILGDVGEDIERIWQFDA